MGTSDGENGTGGCAQAARTKHLHLKPDTLTWCGICGSFAETRANGLLLTCKGPRRELLGVRVAESAQSSTGVGVPGDWSLAAAGDLGGWPPRGRNWNLREVRQAEW